MARIRFQGKEYELPDSETWTIAELSAAEHALGVSFGEQSQADSMGIAFYIAVRRVEKDMPPVVLADAIRQIPMSDLIAEDTPADPLASPETPPSIGPRHLEASA